MTTDSSIEASRSVVIVIPTLNEVHTIESVVDSLYDDPPADAKVSVVVADGGSDDGTVALVQRMQRSRPSLSLLRNPQRIQSAAVNLAARTVGAEADVL